MKQGALLWFTGRPASGKSTLARTIQFELKQFARPVVLLDGDEVRSCLHPALGYDEAARDGFYATLTDLAVLLEGQGLVVLVAATANRRSFRDRARKAAACFVEVYVRCSEAVCAERDPKGLYAASRTGSLSALPGAGAPYEAPEHAEVVIDTGGEQAVDAAKNATAAVLSALAAAQNGMSSSPPPP